MEHALRHPPPPPPPPPPQFSALLTANISPTLLLWQFDHVLPVVFALS
jgi:hypothetical protein